MGDRASGAALAVAAWFIAVNLASVFAFWLDKRRALAAGRGRRAPSRIPERTLLLLALAGGSPGAFHARARFRHKTRKQPFVNNLRLVAALQVGLLLGLGWLFVSGRI